MELTAHSYLTPKNRKAALRQAAHLTSILESKYKKGENLMKKQLQLEEKVQRLTAELEKLQGLIDSLEKDSETYRVQLERLKTTFDLTEVEILDTKLALLRAQLSEKELERLTGIESEASLLADIF